WLAFHLAYSRENHAKNAANDTGYVPAWPRLDAFGVACAGTRPRLMSPRATNGSPRGLGDLEQKEIRQATPETGQAPTGVRSGTDSSAAGGSWRDFAWTW